MIDMVCPACADECEVDPADLEGAESIECEACGAEFPFTLTDGKIVLGALLEPEESDEDFDDEDGDEDGDDTEIEEVDEDEDGDA